MELSISPIKRIDRDSDALVIIWQDGEQTSLPHLWLRENAPENRDPFTGEKLHYYRHPEPAPCPRSVAVEYDETLVVSWAGLWEVTRYPLAKLRDCEPEIESPELALAAD